MTDNAPESTGDGADEGTVWEQLRPSFRKWPAPTLDPYGFPWFLSKLMSFFFLLFALPSAAQELISYFSTDQKIALSKEDVRFAGLVAMTVLSIPIWLFVDFIFNSIVYFIRRWLLVVLVSALAILIPLYVMGLSFSWFRKLFSMIIGGA